MALRAKLIGLALTLVMAGTVAAQNGTSASNRSARRTASIAGRIITAEGAAADGARVVVYAAVEGAPGGIVGTATSSYDGRYEVMGLPAGTFFVGVTPLKASGFGGDLKRAPSLRVETLYPGVTDRDRAQPVTLFEGVPAEGIDVWLAPAPQRFALSGRVFWPEGANISNLTIEYGGPDAVRHGVWYIDDPGGLFAIDGIAQGTYVLLAYADTPTGRMMGLASTDVSLGSVEDIRLLLRSPGSIEGRVVVEGAAKALPAELRVAPVQMLLSLSPLYPALEAAVASDGHFQISDVMGEYTFNVHGLPDGWRVRRVLRNGIAQPNNKAAVAAGERVSGVEIVIGVGST